MAKTKLFDGSAPEAGRLEEILLTNADYRIAVEKRGQLQDGLKALRTRQEKLKTQARESCQLDGRVDALLADKPPAATLSAVQSQLRQVRDEILVHSAALEKHGHEISRVRNIAGGPIMEKGREYYLAIIHERLQLEKRLAELNEQESDFHSALRAAEIPNHCQPSFSPRIGQWRDEQAGVKLRARELFRAGTLTEKELKTFLES